MDPTSPNHELSPSRSWQVEPKKGEAKKSKDEARKEREALESLCKQNAYACAIELLKSTAVDGQPTRVFRLGEYVPFVLASKSGGAGKSVQFENVASLEEVLLRRVPVNLKLLYSNRLLPAIFGQIQERSGSATKAAALADKPALLGRLLPAERIASFRSEARQP